MTDLSAPDAGEAVLFSDAGQRDRNIVEYPVQDSRTTKPVGLSAIAQDLCDRAGPLDLFERLALIRAQIPGRLVLTTSFGLEDQALSHAIFSQDLAIEVVTLDTGRLFSETHDVWNETEQRYGARVRAFVPAPKDLEALIARQGTNGFRASTAARHACCEVRKVVPLGRALADARGWVTGLRADQSADRAQVNMAALDKHRNLIKINPLCDWSREAVVDFVRTHEVPYNALHDRGFLSIGCAPCTRAVQPGESERAGRWWWEQESQKECGLHITADGRVERARPMRSANGQTV